jgi:hypothetical protein
MMFTVKNALFDRLKGGLVLALILFGALVILGRPDAPAAVPEAVAAQPGAGVGPYHTIDAF